MKIVSKIEYDDKMKKFSSPKEKRTYYHYLSDNNSNNIKRPIYHYPSFKGRFFNAEKTIKTYGKELGSSAEKNLRAAIKQAAETKNSGLIFKNNAVDINHLSQGKHVAQVLTYPVTKMPLDIINSFLGAVNKFSIVKKSGIAEQIMDTKLLKTRRIEAENVSNIASIERLFEMTKGGKDVSSELFKNAHKRLDPKVGNYDSTVERAVTRTVTGLIPAFFLAKDAYNLSMYLNDNKNKAKEAKSRRFKQEISRIAITAMTTFMALKMFSKSSNSSGKVTALIISSVTLASEAIGRIMAGNPVLPINEKTAVKYAKKQGKYKEEAQEKTQDKTTQKTEKNKGPLTLKNLGKLVVGLVGLGFAADKISNIKSVKNLLGEISSKYKNLYQKDFVISQADFAKITDKLNQNGFSGLAKKYKQIAEKSMKNGSINLGKVDDKAKYVLIHQILTFPPRFAWDVLNAPYKKIVKPLGQMISNKISPKEVEKISPKNIKATQNSAKELASQQKILINSINTLKRLANKNDADYAKIVNEKLLSSLDSATKSSVSNADLSSIVKNSASTVTSAFLIADNYNMVMIDSQGKNKELAEQKAKERTIQRAIRILYGAFLIKLFNNIFSVPYNASLLGAQAVNTANTFAIETLERKSVGLPLHEATKDEIMELENKNINAKGIKGKYFRLMSKITGKKTMSQRAVKKN